MNASPLPTAPSPWTVCDADALLRTGDYTTLDRLFDAALAASLRDRAGEERYQDALPADFRPCLEAGPAGLARLRAWQAANPRSAHAWLAEAHYWFHWSYEYRGSGWAASVTQDGWTCAHVCTAHVAACALRALELEATLWSAPALLMQSVAAFEEPDWLAELIRSGTGPGADVAPAVRLEAMEPAEREALSAQLARSGLRGDERIVCPATRPAALPPPLQGRKMLSGRNYWMQATLHIHPRLFFFLRQCIWFMQPRWGGSHERVLAFIDSATCAHLDAVEKDRLRHEIWRDDFLGSEPDADDDPEDVRRWMDATRRRADESLYPYHRWETLRWMAAGHFARGERSQALALLKEAETHWPIDDDQTMARALRLACELEPDDPSWIGQAIVRSAHGGECAAAMILHGHFSREGLLGFDPDPVRGEAWLEAARQFAPRTLAWNILAATLQDIGREADAFALASLGHAAGGDSCEYLLGLFHQDGVHVDPDLQQAIRYYREAMEAGGNMGAYKLGYACYELSRAASDPAERTRLLLEAIEAAGRAHAMEHSEGLQSQLMFIGCLEDAPARHRHAALVREHAHKGDPIAMAVLSGMLADRSDEAMFDYRESVRWMLGAQAVAPDDEFVKETLRICHEDGFLARLNFKLHRKQIKAHEIPGADNAMV